MAILDRGRMEIPISAVWPPPSDMPAGDLALACFLLWGFDHLLRRQPQATRRRGRNLIAKMKLFLHEKIRVFLRHSTHSQTSHYPTSRLLASSFGGAEYVFTTNTSLIQQSVQCCCCRRLDWFRNSIIPVRRLKRSQNSTCQPSNHTNMTTTSGFPPQMSSTYSLTRPYSAQASPLRKSPWSNPSQLQAPTAVFDVLSVS